MATPFNGEELYAKRSFITSLFGLKFNKSNSSSNGASSSKNSHHPPQIPPPQTSEHAYTTPTDQPCSSRSLFASHQAQQAQHQPQQSGVLADPYKLSTGDYDGRERTLSEQLADTLLLTSQHASPEPILSPHDIYQEIVCECAHFEQTDHNHHHQTHHSHVATSVSAHPHQTQQQQPLQAAPTHQTYHQHPHDPSGNGAAQQHPINPQLPLNYFTYPPITPIPYSAVSPSPMPTPTPMCPNCHHNMSVPAPPTTPQDRKPATVIEELVNRTNLEDLVKLVVAAVKDAGGLGKNERKVESPEEILRRKRQQNNEAAARYRRRQREAKMHVTTELEQLTNRNAELKAQLSRLQDQISQAKAKISTTQVASSEVYSAPYSRSS
uniref:BZIP domain-containing protein n=1 Tax=Panagrellus redivivus TaxID=6233 RepID=A0A7E4V5R3_PANRE